MLLDNTYVSFETRLFIKMNLPDLNIIDNFEYYDDKIMYDAASKQTIVVPKLNKKLETTEIHTKEILDSVDNLQTIVNGVIVKYNESYYLNSNLNSIIFNIPEFNIKKDIPIKHFPEVLDKYAIRGRNRYYCFSNLKCFLDFVDELKDGFCYNCSKRQYDKFIQDLDNFFKSHDGIFMLKVYINDYFLEFIDKK